MVLRSHFMSSKMKFCTPAEDELRRAGGGVGADCGHGEDEPAVVEGCARSPVGDGLQEGQCAGMLMGCWGMLGGIGVGRLGEERAGWRRSTQLMNRLENICVLVCFAFL